MEPIAKRLKSFLQFKGLTTTAFTRTLQYTSCEKVARLFRVSGAKPSVDILEDIAKHFQELNLRWLITGQGEMLCGPASVMHSEMKPEVALSGEEEQDPELLFIHTANNHQSFPSFVLQSDTLTHSEKEMEKASKPLLGSLVNFIENIREEQ